MFINKAFAADSTINQASSLLSFLPMLLIFGIFYFFIIRPQSKKQKEHQQMLKNLKKGDKIITSSGIYGTIVKCEENDKSAQVEISPNIKIRLQLQSISQIVSESKSEEENVKNNQKSKVAA